MNRASEIIAVAYVARHCTEYGCPKCSAHVRWSRRKKWQFKENPNRRATGRK